MKKTRLEYFTICGISMLLVLLASCSKDSHQPSGAPIRPVVSGSSKYVTSLFQYLPAPGQFINTALGDSAGAFAILGSKNNLVSLGAWGGTIVLGFDHTVINRPDTVDLMLYGNAFAAFAEPGIVWVMADVNGNGKPDDEWFELAGSEYQKPGYKKNYAITYTRPDSPNANIAWTDNEGRTGFVLTTTFHQQGCFPVWISGNQYTLTGSLLPDSNISVQNQNSIISNAFAFGYADNAAGGDAVDIDNAVDASGNKVYLAGIDFIKIQTGIQFNLGWLGELSTEVGGVADISLGLDQ